MGTPRAAAALAVLEHRTGGPLTFGRLLAAIRRGEAETQAVFAARLGIPKQHLSDIEHGRRGVSVERAAAWATTLGYHAGQFVELALQAQVRAAGLPFTVSVARGPRSRLRRRVPPRGAA
jgi:transcriptional regulator with XRE-family HTH domain